MAVIEKLKLTDWYFHTELIVETFLFVIFESILQMVCMELLIMENCAIIDIVLVRAWPVGSADQVDFPVAPWGDITIPRAFPPPVRTWLCNPIPLGSPLQTNRKYNIELNSLIEPACLPPSTGKICWPNQSMHSVRAVKLPSIVAFYKL